MAPADAWLQAAHDPAKRGGILSLPCAFGKCLGIDTPVMMYDGMIKKVQDIVVDDLLMGDDSTPRKVLSLARGKDTMYKVTPKSPASNSYIVNESHILSLKCSTNWSLAEQPGVASKKYYKGALIDISVTDYLNLPPSFHRLGGPLLGYKVAVDYPEIKIDFDPYIVGVWLGDGY